MAEQEQPTKPNEESELARAMAAIPDEPLLPVEKQLIAGSLLLGVVLLGVLYWLSQVLFPTGGAPG
jgi:hypothetical protein